MSAMKKQQGMTAVGVLMVLALIAFFTLLVLRLVPPYLENFNVTSSLKSLQQEVGIKDKSPGEIRNLLQRRFDINDVTNVKRENVTVAKDAKSGLLKIAVEYEVRVPIMLNVDAVVVFSDSIEVATR
ncbi:MAG: DUF4845 domain-containing protein [Proteobacteria bacterium]|nr:MAG: DUF4845 domain-containing protein [Pseudomonadota bacterium]